MSQKRVVIIGAGIMGQGLAQTIAKTGSEVLMIDTTETVLKSGLEKIGKALDAEIARWGLTESEKRAILARISSSMKLEDAAKGSFIIEAIHEDLPAKQELFTKLDKICPAEAILITNTATLAITDIALHTRHPERIIGLHFINPVPKTPVVEVVRGEKTSEQTLEMTLRLLKMLDKTPVQVYETPGFITTRILLPMINEAVRVLSDHVATCEDIDKAMKLGFGLKMGPLAMADVIGIDAIVKWMENLHHETGENTFVPAKFLRKLVRAGYHGVKTHRGFYRYENDGTRIEGSAITPSDLSIGARRAGKD